MTALALVAFGAVSIAKGLAGRSTVRDSLEQEKVVGLAQMTPDRIVAYARRSGYTGKIDKPDCSVAGKKIEDGDSARCFTRYMRIDALIATRGRTYAQMPAFVDKDGKLTDVIAKARITPRGVIVTNPARTVWVTETALSTALNTSYMAEQISLFGIGTGVVLLLVGLVLGAVGIRGKV